MDDNLVDLVLLKNGLLFNTFCQRSVRDLLSIWFIDMAGARYIEWQIQYGHLIRHEKIIFKLTITFLAHNIEDIASQILTNLTSGWQPYWISTWPPPQLVINPSFSPQPKTLA